MFDTSITPIDPYSLILVQDDLDDQTEGEQGNVWEIQFNRGELGGISLYSTLSMRALGIRITPIFSNKNENRINLSQFHKNPIIQSACPSYVRISAEVFTEINMGLEYWLIDGKTICGIITVINNSSSPFEGDLQFIINLKPLPGGDFISGVEVDRNYVLKGKTENISPVFFLSGNAKQGKFGNSSIESHYSVKANDIYRFEWCLVTQNEFQDSVDAIHKLPFENFDKETTRIELTNRSSTFLVDSGNPAWDKTFISSQKSCHQLIKSGLSDEGNLFFLDKVNPENPISLIDQITPLQLWYFSQVIPNQTIKIKDRLMAFFASQKEDGFIPNHLSHDDPQSRFHAFPILAKLTYEIFSQDEGYSDSAFILNHLIMYLKKWLKNQSPYWENALQSFYEDLPIHNIFDQKNNPIHTKWVDSPFLNTLLYQEVDYCLKLADLFSLELNEKEWFDDKKGFILKQIQESWNAKLGIFRYRDIGTKKTPRKKNILKVKEAGSYPVEHDLGSPLRLSISITLEQEISRNIQIIIFGSSEGNEITETITARQISWGNLFGFATTSILFEKIKQIEVNHFPQGNKMEIFTSDFSQVDLSCCVPINLEVLPKQQKDKITSTWLEDYFLSPHGFPLVPKKYQSNQSEKQNIVDLPLVTMIMEGLIKNGNRKLAYGLFEKLMNIVSENLRIYKNFYQYFDVDDGSCKGEYNIINGLVPLKVFFNLLGIQHWTENEIKITGDNVVENGVSIQFRGTKLVCSKDGYTIFTSDGKSLELKEDKIYEIKIPS